MALLPNDASKSTFVGLSLFGVFALLGCYTVNGAFVQALQTMYTGTFSDGTPLHTTYTGLRPLDFLLSLAPTFWYPVLTRSSPGMLLSRTFYMYVQSLAAWATVEVFRAGQKPWFVRWGPAFCTLGMYLGVGTVVPFHCFYDLVRHFNPPEKRPGTPPADPSVPYYRAMCVPVAVLVAYIWPYYVLHYPPSGMNAAQYQILLVLALFVSVFGYSVVLVGAKFLALVHHRRAATTSHADLPWVKATYAIMAVFSARAHWNVVRDITRSADPAILFSTVFVPDLAVGVFGSPASKAVQMVPEALFFLQWDMIIAVLAMSVWAARVTEAMYCSSPAELGWTASTRALVASAFAVAGYLVNPGTVLSVLLYAREDFIRKEYVAANADSRVAKKEM